MARKKRKYEQIRRAESQEETRRRIVEATVELHTTLGPARTSIMAIAERAGVERPTVYRHFPTTEALLVACSSHNAAQNPRPDPDCWLDITDSKARLRKGLGETYAYYSKHETAIWNILRDFEDEPELRRFVPRNVQYRERVLDVLVSAWQDRKDAKAIRAVIGHAIDFFAWRSLRRQGLTDDAAVELMVKLADSA
jgi:AcrR family transcriptional regulator